MKRRDLERHLRAHGAQPLREGSRHAIWAVGGSDAQRIAAVPRHREIKQVTVRAICADLEIPVPQGR